MSAQQPNKTNGAPGTGTPPSAAGNGPKKPNPLNPQSLMQPVKNRGNLRDLLEAMKEGIAAVLPHYLTPDKMLKVTMLAAMQNPDLLLCTGDSLLRSLMIASQMGIEVGPQSGHLVPFNKNIAKRGQPEQWIKEAQFIPDYRGLIGQAKRCGAITKAEAHLVYVDDVFEVDWGSDKPLTHKPNYASKKRTPKDIVACYFRAKLPDGDYQLEVMTLDELEAIREKSKAKDAGPWKDHPGEMYRKTASKRGLKYIPNLDERVIAAIEHDNRIESGDLSAVGLLIDTEQSVAQGMEAATKGRVDDLAEELEKDAAAREANPAGNASTSEPDGFPEGSTTTKPGAQGGAVIDTTATVAGKDEAVTVVSDELKLRDPVVLNGTAYPVEKFATGIADRLTMDQYTSLQDEAARIGRPLADLAQEHLECKADDLSREAAKLWTDFLKTMPDGK